ncbi:TetR/AcrR family transcriptional regulator [Streptomyces sp. NBC_00885]|uniref:TetR/AcrR family transcriptional regulator C-terminal domain-containing protein n=1 Tax=Streptomyces sp. NBC_00885 TaxID=2975857 RepID=UPI0038709A69|nr:TetR/AcrR family transcriptional regulator [Streptomyces sp. NBC_00885]
MPRDGAAGAPGIDPQQLWLRPVQPRRGRKPVHSREAITAAAVALADTEGLEAVTMRRVAAKVGAGVMSLYSYAPDKETLLNLMVDHVSGELPTASTPVGDWRADLKAIAHLQRALMLRHPWLPVALSTRRVPGPHTLAFLERALAALRPTGLDGAAKVEIFAQLTAFVAGHVGHEIAQAAASDSPDRAAAEARYLAAVAADGHHPELAEALSAPGRPLAPEATFARFLNRLIDGLDTD